MTYEYEKQALSEGYTTVCGVDEAGRGPLCGPVCAAAVILPVDCEIEGINDSKKLSEKKREAIFEVIKEKAVAYSVCMVDAKTIDEINILQATFMAMRQAVESLDVKPDIALIDGNGKPGLSIEERTIVKGDAKSISIAAASILAKVSRDRYMKQMDEKYPQYQFVKHKGYGTVLHYEMIAEHGICEEHRRTFLKKSDMNEKRVIGDKGEEFAVRYFEKRGYTILERNYHSRYGEIDIIAGDECFLVFVEVKARKSRSLVSPCEAVDFRKQKKICLTAMKYIAENESYLQPRFDIFEVWQNEGRIYKFNHIEYAFEGIDLDGDYELF